MKQVLYMKLVLHSPDDFNTILGGPWRTLTQQLRPDDGQMGSSPPETKAGFTKG
jgi:hypothetical protein